MDTSSKVIQSTLFCRGSPRRQEARNPYFCSMRTASFGLDGLRPLVNPMKFLVHNLVLMQIEVV